MNAPEQPVLRKSARRWAARGLAALAIAFHLSLLLSWRLGFWNAFTFDSTATRGERGWDFFALYQAGHNVLTGVSAYESDNEAIEVVAPRYTPFRYLPISAYTLGIALNALPPLWAFRLWVALTEGALLACAALSWRLAPDRRRGAVMAAMWLCFTPYYLELYLGQFNVIQAGLVLTMLAAAEPLTPTLSPGAGRGSVGQPCPRYAGRRMQQGGASAGTAKGAPLTPTLSPRAGRGSVGQPSSRCAEGRIQQGGLWSSTGRSDKVLGVAWVLSLLWKQNTGLHAPVLVRQHRWRLLVVASLVVMATSLPYFAAQPGSLSAFLGNLASGTPAPNLGNLGVRQFLYSLASALAPGLSPEGHLWLQRGWVLAVVTVGLVLTFCDRHPSTLLHLCLWTSTYFLVYHHVWEHHYLLALPVLVMLYRRQASPWVLGLWALLAVWTPYVFVDPQGIAAIHAPMRWTPLEPPIVDVLYHASKAVPALGLWAYIVAAMLRRTPEGDRP